MISELRYTFAVRTLSLKVSLRILFARCNILLILVCWYFWYGQRKLTAAD